MTDKRERTAADRRMEEAQMKRERAAADRRMEEAQMKREREAVRRMGEAEERNAALEKQCQSLQKQVVYLKKERDYAEHLEVEKERKCSAERRRMVEAAAAEERKAQCERDYAKREIVEAEERTAELKDKCKGLQGQVDNLEEVLQAETVKRQRLQKECEASLVEGTRLQYEVQTITASRDDFQTYSENLAKEKKKLEDSLRSTKGELAASLRKVEEHEAELGRLKTQVEQLKDRSSELERNLSAETEEYRELERKYTVLEDGRENAQPNEKLVDAKREVQALKDKGRHRREVMQQVVKLLQAQVAAVRSDLDRERSRQNELKDSVEQLLTRSFIVRFLKTGLVSRAAEIRKCKEKLQKCRDELKTTTAERDRLCNTIATKQYMDQQFQRLQEQMARNLVQIITEVVVDVQKVVSAGVSELNKEVQQLQDQTSSTSSVQQSLTAPAPVSKNLTEDGTRPQEMLCMSQPSSGVPNALVKYQPGGAEGASVQCSSPGFAMKFWKGLDSHARSTGQTSRTPSLQGPADFNIKSFMDGCKDDFLNDVKAKPIAAYLKSENVIPSQLNKDIDGADTKKGTLLLFEHFKEQGRPESILILCKVMEESADGHPRMINFAKVLKEKLNKCPH